MPIISRTSVLAPVSLSIIVLARIIGCSGGHDTTAPQILTPPPAPVPAPSPAPSPPAALNVRPSYISVMSHVEYDGASDDLLTAGLGKSGLQSNTPPGYVDALHPTSAELRRAVIYNKYRGIVDTTDGGGFGTLYGPNVTSAGISTTSEGKIPGGEYTAYSDDGSGRQNVTLVVQVPLEFNPKSPCIVGTASPGSTGVFGSISTGEWGLKKGCAVAYTDKGTGGAGHDLMNDTVPLIDGRRVPSSEAGRAAHFHAGLTTDEHTAFNSATPNRFAFKHAHSQRNAEKDWGRYTLQGIEFAFYVLNERLGEKTIDGARLRTFNPENTLVIASGVSNGGGAVLRAAEQDASGLIDGVVASEPAIEMPKEPGVVVRRGAVAQPTISKTLVDFTTHAHLYSACAALAPELSGMPFQASYATFYGSLATGRCASLQGKGLLSAGSTDDQSTQALQKLRDYGWEPEALSQIATMAAFEVAPAVAVTFSNALARASVKDNLCGYSYGATTAAGSPSALDSISLAQMYVLGNGVPPSSGVQLINNLSTGGPMRDLFSTSPSTGRADMNIDGALCLRALLTDVDATAQRLQAGINETRLNGNLHGKPAMIVHGRSDPLLPVNHTSRPYLALNKTVEGDASRLSYIEVTNAQHFDSFIGLQAALPGYDTRFVPLHAYLNQALDAVYDHLRNGTALPPSQVVRTKPRGGSAGSAPPIATANVPSPLAEPLASDRITVEANTVIIAN